jgi:hypothetical protein
MPTQTNLQRIVPRVRRWLLVGAALLAPLAPAALVPESYAYAILESIESISVEAIAGIAAATNALTLMP